MNTGGWLIRNSGTQEKKLEASERWALTSSFGCFLSTRSLPEFLSSKLILPILLLFSPVIRADSLDDLVARAMENNPEVQAALSNWQASQKKAGIVSGLPDPMLGADVERDSTALDEYMGVEYMAEQEFPWFGKRGADRRVAELEAQAAGFEYLEKRRDIHAEVVSKAWKLWAATTSLEALQQIRDLSAQTEKLLAARQEAGQATQAEALQVRITALKLANELAMAERELKVARAELNALLNYDPEKPRPVPENMELPQSDAKLEDLLNQARKYSAILMAALRREEAREAAVKAVKLENRPMISLRVEARQFEESGSIDEVDTGIFLKFPLWQSKYRAMTAEAVSEAEMATADFDVELNMTLLEIQEHYAEVENHLATYQLYESEIVPRALEIVEASSEAYRTGGMEAMGLLMAQQTYQEAIITLYKEKAAYAAAHAALFSIASPWNEAEKATGLPPDR